MGDNSQQLRKIKAFRNSGAKGVNGGDAACVCVTGVRFHSDACASLGLILSLLAEVTRLLLLLLQLLESPTSGAFATFRSRLLLTQARLFLRGWCWLHPSTIS